jgi:sugar lactone lactonase YvrE
MPGHMMLTVVRRWVVPALAALVASAMLAVPSSGQDFPLFVADYGIPAYGGIGVYSLDAGGALTVKAAVPGALGAVRNDADGNLYTCAADSSAVSKIDPAGTVTLYASGFAGCFGLLVAADGTLYVSNLMAGQIEVVPHGGGSSTTLATKLDGPMHLAFDTDGTILVTEYFGGRLSRVDAAGQVTPLVSGLDNPVGVAVGPDDNIYVSELFSGRIMRTDRDGHTTLFALRDDRGPTGLDFHRDGRLFVAELFAGDIVSADAATGLFTVFRDGLKAPVGLSFHRDFIVTLRVAVDLKPGSDANSVNPKSKGMVQVAVLGSDEFDATRVAPATVRFGVTGTEAAPVRSSVQDVNGDGKLDMVFDFSLPALGIPPASPANSLVPLTLTGSTIGGQDIEGSDVARIVGGNPH